MSAWKLLWALLLMSLPCGCKKDSYLVGDPPVRIVEVRGLCFAVAHVQHGEAVSVSMVQVACDQLKPAPVELDCAGTL